MQEIIYHPALNETDRIATDKLFKVFDESYPSVPTVQPKDIPIPSVVKVIWACIWNDPKRIYTLATAVAQRDQLTLVVFADQSKSMYRNEDLIHMMPKIKEDEAAH